MSRPCKRLLCILFIGLLASSRAADLPPANKLLEAVRFSASQNNLLLPGKLRPQKGGKVEPFQIAMKGPEIRFDFTNAPQRSLALQLGQNQGRLLESVNGQPYREVQAADAEKSIGQTDMNYEDIALSYLFWPDAKTLQEDRVGNYLTWKVRVTNPNQGGPYGTLDLWIEQKTGALVQMNGYNREGNLVKNMLVKGFAKVDKNTYMVTKLQVERRNPKDRSVISRTYMDIQKK